MEKLWVARSAALMVQVKVGKTAFLRAEWWAASKGFELVD